VGTSGEYHDVLVVNLCCVLGMVEGYGLANRICIGAVGLLRNILHKHQKGANTRLKPMAFLFFHAQYLPQLTRTSHILPESRGIWWAFPMGYHSIRGSRSGD